MKRTTRRRARVTRINRKRPPFVVEVVREPEPGTRDALVDLLFELLDERVHRK